MKKIFILNDLYVDENFRGQNIAKSLIARAKKFCLEVGAIKMTLSTQKTNERARALYKAEGFEEENEFVVYNLSVR